MSDKLSTAPPPFSANVKVFTIDRKKFFLQAALGKWFFWFEVYIYGTHFGFDISLSYPEEE